MSEIYIIAIVFFIIVLDIVAAVMYFKSNIRISNSDKESISQTKNGDMSGEQNANDIARMKIEKFDYEEMDMGDIYEIKKNLSNEDIVNIQNVINSLIFKKKVEVKPNEEIVYEGVNSPDYQDELKKIKENDEDLKVEVRAYQNGLSLIDPYDKENLNGYRDFLYKVSKLNELEHTKSK